MGQTRLHVLALAILLALPAAVIPVAGAKEDTLDPVRRELDEGVGTSNASCPLGSGVIPLTDGVTTTSSLPAVTGASCEFSFALSGAPGTSTKVELFGLASDYDLYVKRGSVPTTSSYDCRPFLGGLVNETCTVTNNGLTVYAMVRRFSGSGAFSIRATEFVPPPTCSFGTGTVELLAGVSRSDSLTADVGANCQYVFNAGDVVASGEIAKLTLTPSGTNNFDVYVKRGAPPTSTSYDCRSILTGSSVDSCSVELLGTPVYVMVLRSSGSGSFSIRAEQITSCSLGPGLHPLSAGSNAASLGALVGGRCYFSYTPSATVDFAHYVLPPTTPNDFDLYVRSGSVPSTTSYDCRPYLGGSSQEVCDLLADGPQFAMVRRFSGAGGAFDLQVTEVVVPVLENGVPVLANAAAGSMTYYKVVMPGADANGYAPTQLAIATAGDMAGAACAAVDANAGAGTCLAARNADATACATANTANPGTCAGAYTAVADACTQVNTVNPGTCSGAPDVLVGVPNVDLYVRHRVGLPTTSVSHCKGTGAGSTESCVFSTEGAQASTDARAAYTQARADAWTTVGPNCPDPTVCGTNPLPLFPATSNLVPFLGAGKYFVGVRGTTGPADYAIVAAWV